MGIFSKFSKYIYQHYSKNMFYCIFTKKFPYISKKCSNNFRGAFAVAKPPFIQLFALPPVDGPPPNSEGLTPQNSPDLHCTSIGLSQGLVRLMTPPLAVLRTVFLTYYILGSSFVVLGVWTRKRFYNYKFDLIINSCSKRNSTTSRIHSMRRKYYR